MGAAGRSSHGSRNERGSGRDGRLRSRAAVTTALPDPVPGLVIRYAYLWRSEKRAGLEEGRKDRPCVVVVAVRRERGETKVVVSPITHTVPEDPSCAVEIPPSTKARLSLDDERSWIVTDEVNVFTWPGPDLRIVDREDPARRFAYGFLPKGLTKAVIESLRVQTKAGSTKAVDRD
ncbi:MAG: type II toxin-antitoxin system PemK/MazF family toxin [Rhizobiaceae bacterium]|nr:type II toxin-antitoxin system PemK/MazF family toxin [Rhizobiaceae bacterium]